MASYCGVLQIDGLLSGIDSTIYQVSGFHFVLGLNQNVVIVGIDLRDAALSQLQIDTMVRVRLSTRTIG